MERFFQAIRLPGAKYAVECAAPTQTVHVTPSENDEELNESTENVNLYILAMKPKLLDRWLDKVVRFSGSEFTFFSILAGLLAWAFLGIPFGHATDWQVAISDIQAILNMVFDSFLMRQQFNSYDQLLVVLSCLRSRIITNKKMLGKLMKDAKYEKVVQTPFPDLKQTEFASELPTENLLGRTCTAVSSFMGHIATVSVFWVCIFIWLGFGHYCGWSDRWELYINSATSALMLFLLAFLANIRERHSKYTARCLESIYKIDSALELKLRSMTGHMTPNEPVLIPPPKVSKIQRGIDYYADLVGTLVGIVILIAVMIIWVLIGPAMHFDSNWWLLIGTYAGLVGMNDGFVLRNVYNKQRVHEDVHSTQLAYDDLDMLAAIGVTQLAEERVADKSLSCRISVAMGNFCSHELTVVFGVIAILGLVIGASAMRWSLTGQLLCNIPPSIVESFFTMILITGHNIGEAKRRVDLHNIYLRRLTIFSYVNILVRLESVPVESPEIESPEIESSEIESPEIESPEIESPEIESSEIESPEIESPEIESPEIESPEIENPETESPETESTDNVKAIESERMKPHETDGGIDWTQRGLDRSDLQPAISIRDLLLTPGIEIDRQRAQWPNDEVQ